MANALIRYQTPACHNPSSQPALKAETPHVARLLAADLYRGCGLSHADGTGTSGRARRLLGHLPARPPFANLWSARVLMARNRGWLDDARHVYGARDNWYREHG